MGAYSGLFAIAYGFPGLIAADTALQEKPCYSGLFYTEQVIFEEDHLAADDIGYCGLNGLGISREKALELLLNNKDKKDIRALVAPEIMVVAV